MARIPGFDELIKQFIEAMKNEDALKTSESPPQRTFPIGPAGGVQSAIEITKNIGSKVAEANKKAEKIIGLGESYISGEMTFPEYLNRVQEATLSQGSVLGLPSKKIGLVIRFLSEGIRRGLLGGKKKVLTLT